MHEHVAPMSAFVTLITAIVSSLTAVASTCCATLPMSLCAGAVHVIVGNCSWHSTTAQRRGKDATRDTWVV